MFPLVLAALGVGYLLGRWHGIGIGEARVRRQINGGRRIVALDRRET